MIQSRFDSLDKAEATGRSIWTIRRAKRRKARRYGQQRVLPILTPTGTRRTRAIYCISRDRLSALRRWPGQAGTNGRRLRTSLDVQATTRNGNISVKRLSSRLNVGKAIKIGLDHAHGPLRLVAFKKQPLVQVCKGQCASTSKCAGPKLSITDGPNKSRFTLASIAIKKDNGCLSFCTDHCRLSQDAKIDSGAPTIRHVFIIRHAQRISYSESCVFEVGERLDVIARRADRSFGCTFGELNNERTGTTAPAARDEFTEDADKSFCRTIFFMGDDRRNSACHCLHRCDVEHSKVLMDHHCDEGTFIKESLALMHRSV